MENPAERVERPVVISGEPGILTTAQMRRVLRWCEVNDLLLTRFVALGAFGGVQCLECARLVEADLCPNVVSIRGVASKTRQRRLATISPNLRLAGAPR